MRTDHGSHTTPERRLMMATVLEALRDALGNGTVNRPTEREHARRQALSWFREGGPDFQLVCTLAGLDPECTRRAALDVIAGKKILPRRRPPRRLSAAEHATSPPTKPRRPAGRMWPCSASASQIATYADVSESAVRAVVYAHAPTSADMQRRVHRAIQELAQKAADAA